MTIMHEYVSVNQHASPARDPTLPLYHEKKSPRARVSQAIRLPVKLFICAFVVVLSFLGYRHLCSHLFLTEVVSSGRQEPRNPAYLIKARNGAVASENVLCSEIGVQILRDGGNAVDAAIGATFCTGVVNMFSSGIGGGGFMTIRIPPSGSNATSEVYTIDFRETAPELSNTTMYVGDPELAMYGGLSVGVPGEIRGLEEAHRRWGSLSWKRLVDPSVSLAKGWPVGRELGRRIPWFLELMLNNSDWREIFAPGGEPLKVGETIRRTNLSRTLATIAKEGPDSFYNGPIAESIVRKVQQTGGILSLSDLQNYKVKVDRALEGTYHGKKVYTTHEPTSGPVLLHMLNLLEKFDIREQNGLNAHRIVEIMKFGFAARTKICDPDFNDDPLRIKQIATKAYADQIFRNITDDRTHSPDYYNPEYDIKVDHGTSHTSVVDKNGMAVALTSTVNLVFGSQVLDPDTGIIMNDEMDDFSTPGVPNAFGLWPSPYNYPEAGKRPLSSTTPTIIEDLDGSFFLAIGGSGGSQIFSAIFQILVNIERGMDISKSIEFGRLHDQLYPMITFVDDVYPPDIIGDLRSRGHNMSVEDINRVAAVVQAITVQDDVIYAASDSRKNGIAAGY